MIISFQFHVSFEELAKQMRSLFSQFFVRHLAVLYGDGLVLDLEGRPLDLAHDLVVGVVHGVEIHLGLLVLELVPRPKVLGVS